MSRLARPAVRRVIDVLAAHGLEDRVVELSDTARTARDAANALGVEVGAIVKSLVFTIDGRPVVALVAGDRRCHTEALAAATGLAGAVARAEPALVKAATGFTIGGVAPLGFPTSLPVAVDASLERFTDLYAAAGHPYCVFRTTYPELLTLSGGRPSAALGAD